MIIIKNLTKNYDKKLILNNIFLKINSGEIFGIIGKSGSGKSTLLRCMNGLENYQKGSIKILGKEIKDLSFKELSIFQKDIGMIFQNFNLMKRSTVFENIALPLKIHKFKYKFINKKVQELLNLVDLNDKKNEFISKLSGGEKQRIGIARALALNPKILLCDEATSSLDPKTTNNILYLLNQINKTMNITIVIVSHQMEVIKSICKRTLVLDKGEIKVTDTTENLFLRNINMLKSLYIENELLSKKDINIKIFFNNRNSEKTIITSMARKLNINFSIVWGKLEAFRSNVLGSLIINIPIKNLNIVEKYLKEKNIYWEVLKNE